jgi:hypothetical protein
VGHPAINSHAVILRKRTPSQSEDLPTKDLCICTPLQIVIPTGASHFRRKWKAEWRDLLFPRKHRNPALARPWSSFRHYLTGETSTVEIESQWTARRREQLGIFPTVRTRSAEETPRPSEKLGRATLGSKMKTIVRATRP